MVKLSASKIKTLSHCSFLYWVKYHTDFPKETNDGARRGTCTHILLESLLNERHVTHFQLVKKGGIKASPACERLIRKSMKKEGLFKEDDFDLIDGFVKVALDNDFFMEGFDLEKPEFPFNIKTDKFHLVGFIDKLGFKGDVCRIEDYKTSKSKASGEDLRFNIQALSYQLAVKILFPEIKRSFVNFLFLKFSKNPRQVFSVANEKLEGFKEYLRYLSSYLEDFGEDKIKSNYGWNNPSKKPLCGKVGFKEDGVTPHWICPAAMARDYFVLVKNGKVIDSKFEEKDLTLIEGAVIEKRWHKGCEIFLKNNKNLRRT